MSLDQKGGRLSSLLMECLPPDSWGDEGVAERRLVLRGRSFGGHMESAHEAHGGHMKSAHMRFSCVLYGPLRGTLGRKWTGAPVARADPLLSLRLGPLPSSEGYPFPGERELRAVWESAGPCLHFWGIDPAAPHPTWGRAPSTASAGHVLFLDLLIHPAGLWAAGSFFHMNQWFSAN